VQVKRCSWKANTRRRRRAHRAPQPAWPPSPPGGGHSRR
jgi:hypothetical protein